MTPFVQIPSGDKRTHFAIGDRAFEHPETAVGIYVFDAALAQYGLRALEPPRDRFGRFDFRGFDIDNAEPYTDLRPEIAEYGEFVRRPVRRFEHDVIRMKRIQIRQ